LSAHRADVKLWVIFAPPLRAIMDLLIPESNLVSILPRRPYDSCARA